MSFLSESKTIQKRFKVPPRCLNLLLLFYNYFLVHPPPPRPPTPPAEGSEEVSEETVRHPLVGGPETWRSLTSLSCREPRLLHRVQRSWPQSVSFTRNGTIKHLNTQCDGTEPNGSNQEEEWADVQLEFNLGGWDSMKRPSNSGFMFGRWRMMTVCVCVVIGRYRCRWVSVIRWTWTVTPNITPPAPPPSVDHYWHVPPFPPPTVPPHLVLILHRSSRFSLAKNT